MRCSVIVNHISRLPDLGANCRNHPCQSPPLVLRDLQAPRSRAGPAARRRGGSARGLRLAVVDGPGLRCLANAIHRARARSGEHLVVEIDDTPGAPGRRSTARAHRARRAGRRRPDGRLLGELPEVEIGLSTAALLFDGAVAVRQIAATAPSLKLTRREDGSIGFGDERDPAACGQVRSQRLLFAEFSGAPRSPPRGGATSRKSGCPAASSCWRTGRSGALCRARNADLRITPSGERRRARGCGSRSSRRPSRQPSTSRQPMSRAGPHRGRGRFRGLCPGEARRLCSGSAIGGHRLAIEWQGDGRRVAGGRAPRRSASTSPRSPAMIELVHLELDALPVEAMAVRGTLAADLGGVVIDRLSFSSNGAHLTGRGEATWRRRRDRRSMPTSRRRTSPRRDLERYWPPNEGREAREWVIDNITAGVVPKVQATLRFEPGELGLKPLPEHTLDGEFVFEDVTVRYVDTMPPVIGVARAARRLPGSAWISTSAAGHVGRPGGRSRQHRDHRDRDQRPRHHPARDRGRR